MANETQSQGAQEGSTQPNLQTPEAAWSKKENRLLKDIAARLLLKRKDWDHDI